MEEGGEGEKEGERVMKGRRTSLIEREKEGKRARKERKQEENKNREVETEGGVTDD